MAAAYTTELLKFMPEETSHSEPVSKPDQILIGESRGSVQSRETSHSQPILEQVSTSASDIFFGSTIPSILRKPFFFYHNYGPYSILLLLCRSDDAWHTISRKLQCGGCGDEFWKSQNHNCAMTGLGSTIVGLLAITSMLLPFANQVHWITRALWIVSILSAFLSVLFVCKHQMFIGHLVLVEEHHKHKGGDDSSVGTNDILKMPGKDKTPRLSAVLMFSISRAFLDYALLAYIIGLGTYLGFIWQYNLDDQAGHFDSRNIFIVFIVFVSFCIFIYFQPTYPKPYERLWAVDSKATEDA